MENEIQTQSSNGTGLSEGRISILHFALCNIHFAIKSPFLKPSVFIVCLIPAAQLVYDALTDNLGANPIEAITRFTGSWALTFLLVTLAVTPLRKLTGWNELIRFRRMLGLFAFFYATLHFLTFVVLDHFFDFDRILKDVVKRPYVTAGFTSLVLMIPLAITSTQGMIRRLGKRWQLLHRLVYLAAIAAVVHFYWLVKADVRRPVQYGTVLVLLLAYRLIVKYSPTLAGRFTRRGTVPLA